ncbi:MAG: YcaO-like family protein, partial [Bacteroidota bacterium]
MSNPTVSYSIPDALQRTHPARFDRGHSFRIVEHPAAVEALQLLARAPHTADALATRLGRPRTDVADMLHALEVGGVAIGTTPAFQASAARWWARHGASLPATRDRLAASPIRLIAPEADRASLLEDLLRIGIRVESEGIPVAFNPSVGTARALNSSALRDGTPWIWASCDGTRSDIAVFTGDPGCYACLVARLRYNRPHVPIGEPGEPQQSEESDALRRRALHCLTFTAAALVSGIDLPGAVPVATLAAESVWDLPTESPLPTLPLCPACGHTRPFGTAPPSLLDGTPLGGTEGGRRAVALGDALARAEGWIDPHTGIGRSVHAIRPNALAALYRRPLAADTPAASATATAGGKGRSPLQRLMSLYGEIAERVSGGFHSAIEHVVTRRSDLVGPSLDPNTLSGVSETQSATRHAWNATAPPALWIPDPYSDEPIRWVKAWPLAHDLSWGAPVWIPATAAFYDVPDADPYARATSNGCSAAMTTTDAVLQAAYELVERDARAQWWAAGASPPPWHAAPDPFIDAARQALVAGGRDLRLLDLTTDLGIPVVAAASRRLEGDARWALGFGCHLDPRIAASRAVTELDQTIPNAERAPLWRPAGTEGTPVSDRCFAADPDAVAVDRLEPAATLLGDLCLVVGALTDRGIPLYVVDQTHPLV